VHTSISSQDFGDLFEEWEAVRSSVGALDLRSTGRLRVTGKDRVRFLHNMLSNDIRNLASGSGCHALLLSRQGHVEADLWVYVHDNEIWLECPSACARQLFETLSRFIVADAVTIEDLAERVGILSLQGPQAAATVARTLGAPFESLPLFSHKTYERPSGLWTLVCRDRSGCGGYDLWLPSRDLDAVWRNWIEAECIQSVGYPALNIVRTEAGIPWYGQDVDDRSLPMEVGLGDAISMAKGCYRGQEIVARVTHRGHLDRGLGGIAIEAEVIPPAGAGVFAGETQAGKVTSAVISPMLERALALAILRRESAAPGTAVDVACGDARQRGMVVSLPLHSPRIERG
jgi:folate-binding protein YgfZ